MKLKDTPIQLKLMRVILLTCGAVLILSCTTFFTYELITFRETTKRHLSTLGRIIAANSTAALAFDSREDANEVLAALKAEEHVVAACLFDKEGQLFAQYPESHPVHDFPSANGAPGYRFNNVYLEGFQPVETNDSRLGTLYLRSSINAMYDRSKLYGMFALLVIFASFVFAYFLSRRLQKTVSQPILALADTARTISERRDYSVRASKSGNDELGLLTEAFNHMLDQIEAKNSEIVQFNQNLEQKIRERTNELEFANIVLLQQNEFVETIIDSSVDVISVFDSSMNYVILNRHAEQVYGVKKENVVGKNILTVFPQVKNSPILDDLKKALEGETIYNARYWSPVINRHFENFYVPLRNAEGQVDRVLAVAHDVTNIIEAHEKLKSLNRELEKSNRDLEQFASVASHDLQEPLRKIQTFSELAERSLSNEDPNKVYLTKINSSAQRMARLIHAVLNYSRLSNSPQQFEAIDLNTILENIKSDLELVVAEKNAVITTDRLPTINGIPLQINQLLLNLISNSLKFSEERPRIDIRFRIVDGGMIRDQKAQHVEGTFAELTFSDNGIGFDQSHYDKIFTIFQRLHSAKKYAGTGIGLALCKKIVENHHGYISVDSEPGKGTTFFVYLPFTQ